MKLNHLLKPYVVNMALYLMSILLPFNANDSLTFQELRDFTNLPADDLGRHAQQLVDVGILTADVSIQKIFYKMCPNLKRNGATFEDSFTGFIFWCELKKCYWQFEMYPSHIVW